MRSFLSRAKSSSRILKGLLSSSLLVISHLDSNLVTEQAAQFSVILNTTKDLITSVNPNLRVVAFRCLRMLPVQLWASEEANASNELGEKEWGIIMAGLEDREKAIRREVIPIRSDSSARR